MYSLRRPGCGVLLETLAVRVDDGGPVMLANLLVRVSNRVGGGPRAVSNAAQAVVADAARARRRREALAAVEAARATQTSVERTPWVS